MGDIYEAKKSGTVYIPDPVEIVNSKIERYMDEFVNDTTCMQCGIVVDYELYYMSPIGDGPAVCAECAGMQEP